MPPISELLGSLRRTPVQLLVERETPYDQNTWQGAFTGTGVDLIAMVVSDSGLADEEPKWCTAAPLGCILIGLQPRGGWQVMQRAFQWGTDGLTRAFGVRCEEPVLYAFFACSIRNRMEVWDSKDFWSPMQNVSHVGPWQSTDSFAVKRPTKLLDGSRGGQAFICEFLVPAPGKHFSIKEQSHAQLISVMLAATGLMEGKDESEIEGIMQRDFGLSTALSPVFGPLQVGVALANVATLGVVLTVIWSIWHQILYGHFIPYMIKIASILSFSVGATGLLMSGGNPRVEIFQRKIPDHIAERIAAAATLVEVEPAPTEPSTPTETVAVHDTERHSLEVVTKVLVDEEKLPNDTSSKIGLRTTARSSVPPTPLVTAHFGSLHGSIYTPDGGSCALPIATVRRVCSWDIRIKRPTSWYVGIAWFGLQLLLSIIIQVAGSRYNTVGAEAVSIGFLLVTSLGRGRGVAGSEEWMIPRRKRRVGTAAGAQLLGSMKARR